MERELPTSVRLGIMVAAVVSVAASEDRPAPVIEAGQLHRTFVPRVRVERQVLPAGTLCIQRITFARPPGGSEKDERVFPNQCVVPQGWSITGGFTP